MRQFGLIGFPLTHSFSAKFFAGKFETEGTTDAVYSLFPLEDISLLLPFIQKHPDLRGINVTIPHKIAVLPYLSKISEEATSVGAVNCIKIDRNKSDIILTGYNTDIYGFRKSLISLLKPHHQSALVLGTGGASKAVCFTLRELGIKYILVSRARSMDNVLQYSQLSEQIINDNLLIINTTPVGTYSDTDKYPDIPYQYLGNQHLLYDLIYNPSETPFLRLGHESGATTINGLRMLELQAEKSWEIWNAQ